MKNCLFLIPFLLVCCVFSASAQRTCGHTHHQQQLMQDPHYAAEFQQRHLNFETVQAQHPGGRAQCPNPVVLPMAVHYQGISNPDQSCLIALAEQQVQILNDDYAGTNSDISNWVNNASSAFPGVSNGETCIVFCLATQNHPAGHNLSNGQPAVTFNTTSGDFNSDWSGYINIYVRNAGGGILGYSPLGGSGNGDGVVIDDQAFSSGSGCGSVSPGAPYNLGRTLTHELGHYLFLNHIWGDGGCNVDDGVADTPVAQSSYGGCPSIGQQSCSSTDMHMNFMDYTNDACMYMFSAGQSTRMENYVAANLQNVVNNGASVCTFQPQAPVAAISISSQSGCAPLEVTFTDNSGFEPTGWEWSFPGGTPSSYTGQTPPTVTYDTPGTYSATLTATNNLGSDMTSVQVEAIDCANIVCSEINHLAGDTPTLIPSASGYISGHNEYQDIAKAEYFDDYGAASLLTTADFDFGVASGNGNLEFAVWTDNGGQPGAEIANATVPISSIAADVAAGNLTTVDFGIVPITGPFYVGFKLSYSNNSNIAVRTNSDGDTNPSTAWEQWADNSWWPYNDYTNTNTTWEVDVAHAIYPEVCEENVTPTAPTASFSYDLDGGCDEGEVQYNDLSSGIPTAWSWSFPGGTPATSTDQNPTVTYSSPGTYSAELTVTNDLGTDTQMQTDIIVINTDVTANANASATTVDLGATGTDANVDFTDNTGGATSWSWDFGDGSTSTMQNPSHMYSSEGTYTVTLIVSNGPCSDTQTFTVTVTDVTGVEDIEGLNALGIYPNPMTEVFFLDIKTDSNVELNVEVYDAIGRKVIDGGNFTVNGNVARSYDTRHLASGTYFVRVRSGASAATLKLLKL